MLSLKKAGFVNSKRGTAGGFFLIRKPEEITIGDIVRIFEGSLTPFSSAEFMELHMNGNEQEAALQEVWTRVAEEIANVIDHVSLARVLERAEELRAAYTYQI